MFTPLWIVLNIVRFGEQRKEMFHLCQTEAEFNELINKGAGFHLPNENEMQEIEEMILEEQAFAYGSKD